MAATWSVVARKAHRAAPARTLAAARTLVPDGLQGGDVAPVSAGGTAVVAADCPARVGGGA